VPIPPDSFMTVFPRRLQTPASAIIRLFWCVFIKVSQ